MKVIAAKRIIKVRIFRLDIAFTPRTPLIFLCASKLTLLANSVKKGVCEPRMGGLGSFFTAPIRPPVPELERVRKYDGPR